MKNASKWMNQLRRSVNEASKNATTQQVQKQLNATSKQLKKSLDSTSKQIKKSLDYHYHNVPQYRSQLQTQLTKARHQSQQLNTQFKQKFHEVSQSNPTVKHYYSKYQTHAPKLTLKQSIDSTIKRSKNIASSAQSKAKKVSDTSHKISSQISSTSKAFSNISPTKSVSKATSRVTKPVRSMFEATQRVVNPNRINNYLSNMRTWIMIYGFVGISSIMVVNQWSYMTLLYMVRHRYDEEKQTTLFGIDMAWIYKWLNIPYEGDVKHQRLQLIEDLGEHRKSTEGGEEAVSGSVMNTAAFEIHMQDYNISADIKLAKIAYNALLYPRIVAAILLTFGIGTPLIRVAKWLR